MWLVSGAPGANRGDPSRIRGSDRLAGADFGLLGGGLRRRRFELPHQLVEVEALELAGHGVELSLAVLDHDLALAAELERLAELGLPRVEPQDDLLEPLDRGLIALGLVGPGCPGGFT